MQKTLAILMHQPVLPISNRVNAVYNLHTQGVLKLEGILDELLMGVGEASIISGSHKNWGFSNIFHCIILNLHKSGSSRWRRKRLIMMGKEGERATGWPAPEGRHCVCFTSASLWPLATALHHLKPSEFWEWSRYTSPGVTHWPMREKAKTVPALDFISRVIFFLKNCEGSLPPGSPYSRNIFAQCLTPPCLNAH